MNKSQASLPVVVIGAGPVGLAAAAHLVERGLEPIVLEAGDQVGAAIREWGHVRLFSPWRYDIDAAARRLLEPSRLDRSPDPDGLPTGEELVDAVPRPAGGRRPNSPRGSAHRRPGWSPCPASGVDKTRTIDRDEQPLPGPHPTATARSHDIVAHAVIDASGTWGQPNPLGAPASPPPAKPKPPPLGLAGPLPDVLGADRARFAGRRTLVVGMGHSAANTLLDLAELAESRTRHHDHLGDPRRHPGPPLRRWLTPTRCPPAARSAPACGGGRVRRDHPDPRFTITRLDARQTRPVR